MRPPHRIAAAIVALVAAGCASTPEPDPRYRPAENVLEVTAVLRRHVPDDTYRFAPASDFTGRNVYRSSLLRLESMELVHAEALQSGYMDGVIAFAKGRSLERLRAYDLAAGQYRIAAALDQDLEVEALRSADICNELYALSEMAFDLGDFSGDGAGEAMARADNDDVVAAFEARVARLEVLMDEADGTHHVAVILEEIERADVARSLYFESVRKVREDGDVTAVAEQQRVFVRHRESKNSNRHMLALADLYADLAEEYVAAHPPEGLTFDPVRFQELIDAAARLYETVANQDGTSEKLEATRRLEAFLAFALRVDRDRFTP